MRRAHDPVLPLPWQLRGNRSRGDMGGAMTRSPGGRDCVKTHRSYALTETVRVIREMLGFPPSSRHLSEWIIRVFRENCADLLRHKRAERTLTVRQRDLPSRSTDRRQFRVFSGGWGAQNQLLFVVVVVVLESAGLVSSRTSGGMFRKSKSKMLVDYASEEDDMSWHHHHSYKVTRLRSLPTSQMWIICWNDTDRSGSIKNCVHFAQTLF